MRTTTLWICVLVFLGCTSKDELPDISGISINLQLIRLEDEFSRCKTEAAVDSFMNKYPDFALNFFKYDSVRAPQIRRRIAHMTSFPEYDTLYQACKRHVVGIDEAKKELEQALRYIRYYYPNEELPDRIYTFVSGYEPGADLYEKNGMLVWGLEYCLGAKLPYRPPTQLQIYGYMLERMTPQYLPINYVLSFTTRINKSDILDNTALSDMIYYGKAYYFLEKVFPGKPDSLLIGFTDQQVADAEYNLPTIWGHFVKNELLYSTKREVKNRYLDERPKVPEISEECPGRIGRWLGWQIVRSYMRRNPDITLPQLMATTDAKMIFQKSKFRPQPKR